MDKNPSFGVRVEHGDPHCHCFSCGFSGSAGDLLIEFHERYSKKPWGAANIKDAQVIVEQAENDLDINLDTPSIEDLLYGEKPEKFHEFDLWWLNSYPSVFGVDWAEEYLIARDVSEEVCESMDLRADLKQKRICFPVRNFDSVLMGLHGRTTIPDLEPRYLMYPFKGKTNPDIWLGEDWVDFTSPILVVEGPFDVLSCRRVYSNTVSPLFANPSATKLARMHDAYEVITFFDHDLAGSKGRKKVTSSFKYSKVKHVIPPDGMDPGSMNIEQLQSLLGKIVLLDNKP